MGDSQHSSTIGKQRQIPLLGEARKASLVDEHLVSQCADEKAALLLCIQLSGLSYEAICGHLAIDKGHWSRIMQGRAHFPTRKRLALMRLCGNLAPIQYEAMQSGLTVYEDAKAKRKAELKAELEALEQAA